MLTQFLREEDGQTTVEYLLIIAVIVVVISVLGKGLQTRLEQLIGKVFDNIDSKVDELMTGGTQ
ncbi:MAG: multidrug transporter [Bdellovibrionaceae bacterium]|nr:hypothetical protein [Bdellovibrionales bacterium]MCB9254508.1 multidrug transporter [Pseudobdellovibrionaceae bacterium]